MTFIKEPLIQTIWRNQWTSNIFLWSKDRGNCPWKDVCKENLYQWINHLLKILVSLKFIQCYMLANITLLRTFGWWTFHSRHFKDFWSNDFLLHNHITCTITLIINFSIIHSKQLIMSFIYFSWGVGTGFGWKNLLYSSQNDKKKIKI